MDALEDKIMTLLIIAGLKSLLYVFFFFVFDFRFRSFFFVVLLLHAQFSINILNIKTPFLHLAFVQILLAILFGESPGNVFLTFFISQFTIFTK
jgi:hypothetical protein